MKQTIKSTLLLLLCMVMLFGILPSAVNAEDDEPAIVESGTCGENLTWTFDDSGTLTISGTGEMTDYTSTDKSWFNDLDLLKKIVIEEGVASIGDYAFDGCNRVTSVTIPASVTRIGKYAFNGCRNLTEANVPNTVTVIGEYAFLKCTSLTDITIPGGVTGIGAGTFESCSSLKKITIPEGVTTIGDSAFSGCSGLTSVIIPASVTSIGESAFAECEDCASFVFRGDAPEIGEYCFEYVTAWVYYPAGNETWTEDVMQDYEGSLNWFAKSGDTDELPATSGTCGENLTWSLDGAGTLTISGEGAMDDYFGTSRPWDAVKSNIKTVKIEEGVTTIGSAAFSKCENLFRVGYPDTLTAINGNAFYGCGKLENPNFPDNLRHIGGNAFAFCAGLTNIQIPNSVEVLQDNAFTMCNNLAYVSVGSGVKTIGGSAFAYNPKLERVDIKEGVSIIEAEAFLCCNLKSLTLPTSITKIEDTAFQSNEALGEIFFLGSAPVIGDYAFDGVTANAYYSVHDDSWKAECLKNYGGTLTWQAKRYWTDSDSAGDNVNWYFDSADGYLLISGTGEISVYKTGWKKYQKSIKTLVVEEGFTGGIGGFKDCINLSSVTLPDSITEILDNAFRGCTALKEIKLPENLITLGSNSFNGCSALTVIHLPASMESFGAQPFCGCSSLTSIWVDENNPNFTSDEYGVLYNKDMTTLHEAPGLLEGDYMIPDSVTTIEENAFNGCAKLTSIQMPDSVERIWMGAFMNCTSLSKINLSENTYEVPMDAFVNCSSLEEITIPASVTLVFPDAFKGCTGLKAVYFEGDAPIGEVGGDAFPGISAKAYYTPNETWTEKNRQRVSTSLDWVIPQLEAPKVKESNVASSGAIKLKWNAIEGAESYEVYRRAGKTGEYKLLTTTEKTSLTDKDTTPGTVYYYKVKAIHSDPNNNSEFSSAVGQTCDLPQPKLKDVTNSEGPIKVRWTKVEGAKEYAVYRATSKDGPYTKVGTSSGGHLTVKKSNPGTLYYFKIKAIHENSNANSAWSAVLSCPGKLAAPNLYGRESNVKDTGFIKLTWEAREGAEGYEIIRRVNKKGEYEPYATTKDNFFIDTDVTPGIVYEYRARSIHSDSRANSGYGSSAGQTCDLPRPVVKESNVSSTGKIKLKWDKIEGAESYKVYRRVGKTGSYELLTTTESTSLTDKNTTPGTVYYYKVKAVHPNSNANSAKSAGVGQTCDLPKPSVVADLSGKYPVLSWNEIADAEEYKVYRADSKDGSYKLIKTTTSTKFTDKSASTEKTYYYRVKAIHKNTNANSAYCYVEANPEAGVKRTVTNSYVNIRAGAGTNYAKVGKYLKGDVVTIYEETTVDDRPWGRTDKGWICTEYVK